VKSAVRRLLAVGAAAAAVMVPNVPVDAAVATLADGCGGVSQAEAAEKADVVFTGTVMSRTASKGTGTREFAHDLTVELVFKGPISTETVPVITRDETKTVPGLGPLKEDERYLVFGRVVEAEGSPIIVAGGCSGTAVAVADEVARVETLLGQGRPPVTPEPPDPTFTPVEGADPDSFTRSAAPGLALVLIGLLGLVVVRRLGARPPTP
jgi:hypothetical protein